MQNAEPKTQNAALSKLKHVSSTATTENKNAKYAADSIN